MKPKQPRYYMRWGTGIVHGYQVMRDDGEPGHVILGQGMSRDEAEACVDTLNWLINRGAINTEVRAP